MSEDVGRVGAADQALVNQAPTGLGPTGFDPSRIAEIVAAIEPTTLQPIIKRASDEFYEAMLTAVDYYLRENLEYNLGSHIQTLERELQQARTEIYEVDRALGGNPLGHANRIDSIRSLDQRAVQHFELLYQVSKVYEGETRHETALRYIRERDSDGSSEAGETQSGSTVGDSAGRETASPNADRTPA